MISHRITLLTLLRLYLSIVSMSLLFFLALSIDFSMMSLELFSILFLFSLSTETFIVHLRALMALRLTWIEWTIHWKRSVLGQQTLWSPWTYISSAISPFLYSFSEPWYWAESLYFLLAQNVPSACWPTSICISSLFLDEQPHEPPQFFRSAKALQLTGSLGCFLGNKIASVCWAFQGGAIALASSLHFTAGIKWSKMLLIAEWWSLGAWNQY